MRGPAATPSTPARRGRTRQAARDLNTANMADSYFHAQSEKVRWLLTGVLRICMQLKVELFRAGSRFLIL
jgi:hypothetical protein